MKIIFLLLISCLLSSCSYYEKEELKEVLKDYVSFASGFSQKNGRMSEISDDQLYIENVGCRKVTIEKDEAYKYARGVSVWEKSVECYDFGKKNVNSNGKTKTLYVSYSERSQGKSLTTERWVKIYRGKSRCTFYLKDQHDDLVFSKKIQRVTCSQSPIRIFGA